MDELNNDMETLDGQVDCYVIRDQDEVELKTKVRPRAISPNLADISHARSSSRPRRGGGPKSRLMMGICAPARGLPPPTPTPRRRQVWMEMNKEYLEAQQLKEEARRAAEAAGIDPESRPRKPRKNKRKAGGAAADGAEEPESAAEAADGELRRRNLSSRINYEVVSVLNQTLNEDAGYMPTGMDDEMPAGGPSTFPRAPQTDTLSNSGFSENVTDDEAASVNGSHGEPEY